MTGLLTHDAKCTPNDSLLDILKHLFYPFGNHTTKHTHDQVG
jgi:hypothetical protein